jgi:hypothetical protein
VRRAALDFLPTPAYAGRDEAPVGRLCASSFCSRIELAARVLQAIGRVRDVSPKPAEPARFTLLHGWRAVEGGRGASYRFNPA